MKLKNGHRGGNHPVKDLLSGRTQLTVQNHGYAVDQASLGRTNLEVTHKALNDGSIEGLKCTLYNAFSVQFHPEAHRDREDEYTF